MKAPSPPLRNRQNVVDRRRQLLDEAQRIIGERGYHGFGIQELASRCGLTKAGLLHHFGTKDQLLISLLETRDAGNEAEAVRTLDEGGIPPEGPASPRLRLLGAFRAIVARNVAQPELMRLQIVLRAEAINPDHPAHAYFVAREATKRELLAGRLTTLCDDPVAGARRILGQITGLEEQWLREDRGFDLLAETMRALALLVPDASFPNTPFANALFESTP